MINDINELSKKIPNFRISCKDNFYFSEPFFEVPCIYRSGELSRISSKIATTLVTKLGIQCHIDLRSNKEINNHAYPKSLIKCGISWKHYPLSDNTNKFRLVKYPNFKDYYENYCELIITNKETILLILCFIATSSYERFLLSCYAGKDRTGIIIMFIMAIIGIDKKSIIDDYVLTGEYLMNHIHYFKRNWEKRRLLKNEYLHRLQPDERSASMLIENLTRDYGGLVSFLYSLGLTNEIIRKIKSKFFTYRISNSHIQEAQL
jgi:protein-tyrosine phosphatase